MRNVWTYRNEFKDIFCVLENTKNQYLKTEFHWCDTIKDCFETVLNIKMGSDLPVEFYETTYYKEGVVILEVYRAGECITQLFLEDFDNYEKGYYIKKDM